MTPHCKHLTPADVTLLDTLDGPVLAKTLTRLAVVEKINAAKPGTKNTVMSHLADLLPCSITHLTGLAASFRKHGLAGIIPKTTRSTTY